MSKALTTETKTTECGLDDVVVGGVRLVRVSHLTVSDG